MSEFLTLEETYKQLGAVCGSGKLGQEVERMLISAHHHLMLLEAEKKYWKGYVDFVDDCGDAKDLYEESLAEA